MRIKPLLPELLILVLRAQAGLPLVSLKGTSNG
jgi:hypothetical protein